MDGLVNLKRQAIPDVKRLSDKNFQNGAEVLVAIECIRNTKLSKETSDYIYELSQEDIKWKTRQDFLDEMTLSHAKQDTPSKLPRNPTDKQRVAERQRRLNARTTRHRFVFFVWPRDPQTPHFIKVGSENTIMSKTAIHGRQLWGASLFDFHFVQRHPSVTHVQTLSTSSKLLEFVKSVGEDYALARPMVERAEREEDPKIIEPYDIAQLIRNEEREINLYLQIERKKKSEDKRKDGSDRNIVQEDKGVQKGKGKEVENAGEEKENEKDSAERENGTKEEIMEDPPEVAKEDDSKGELKGYSGPYPIESPFSPSCYPDGWMKEPFSGEDEFQWRLTDTPPKLQQYLPQRLLPERLVVHDPCGMLDASEKGSSGIRWSWMGDTTHTYTLNLSTKFNDRKRVEDAAAEKQDADAKQRLENFLANPHSKTERPPGYEKAVEEAAPDGTVAMIYVVLPEAPRPQPAKEAHLYLVPAKNLGVGHHSRVYNAEFEVPRSLLVKEELCMDCVHADVEEQLKERAADLKNARRGKMSRKDIKKPLFLSDGSDNVYLFDEGDLFVKPQAEYSGPYNVVVQTRVGYQNLERAPYCKHFSAREGAVHPLMAKVSVAAKISIEDDDHLEAEAVNYQRFPKPFFEHWSGFNIVRPFQYPVPLGAIVPQFYGHYVPERTEKGRGNYLSPILLLEKCGDPIKFEDLSVDDKQECASLICRLHEFSWSHGSIYERNILRQPGPLDASPNQRLVNTRKRGGYGVSWSFRLIDFGRTEYVGDEEDAEESFEFDLRKVLKWVRGEANPFTN